ncbi:hypothetical protein [Metabacillus fastidiosus]|uniref:Uncharacterized protein n=1 Tax=Metabacillus fastidiosus TaxID=1458 RepID=A0ABU6NYB2_9BACI|nr:hypothetical protein [Metabacillus fastidiosus]MED4402113.1 hypothetical protein [Metabacillus fastidiosus]
MKRIVIGITLLVTVFLGSIQTFANTLDDETRSSQTITDILGPKPPVGPVKNPSTSTTPNTGGTTITDILGPKPPVGPVNPNHVEPVKGKETPNITWSCGTPLISDDVNKSIDEYKENDANMAEKFIASQVQNVFNVGKVAGLNTLVYGNPYCLWLDKDDNLSSDGIFTEKERTTIVDPMMKMLSGVYVTLLVLALLISSLKLGVINVLSPQSRADFWEDVRMWLFSMLFMVAFIPITDIIFNLNTAFTQSIRALLGDKVDGVSIIADFMQDYAEGGDPVTGMMPIIITFLGEWILAIILNFVYIARKIIILVLLVMGPIAAYSMLFAKTRSFLGVWFRELIGNVALQSVHAIILYVFVLLADLGAGVIMKLGLMMMFIPVTGMISRWLNSGDNATKMGTMMAAAGLGGIMSTIMVSQQAGNILRGGNMFSNNSSSSSANNGFNSSSSSAENALISAGGGSDSAITSISSSALGMNSHSWQNTKKGAGALGAFLGASAASVTGNPNAIMAGAKAGQAVSEGVLQTSRNVAYGFSNAAKNLITPFTYNGANGQGIKAFMGNLEARRNFAGNMGESVGSMVGLGSLGRNVGHGLSGVSRNRLVNTPQEKGGLAIRGKDGNYEAPSLKGLAQLYPGARALHMQTNQGSALMMQTPDGQWTRMGLMGQADPTLKNGSVRATPFQFANAANGRLELQENGSYRQVSSPVINAAINPTTQTITPGSGASTPHLMRTGNSPVVGGFNPAGAINSNIAPVNSMSNQSINGNSNVHLSHNPGSQSVNISSPSSINSQHVTAGSNVNLTRSPSPQQVSAGPNFNLTRSSGPQQVVAGSPVNLTGNPGLPPNMSNQNISSSGNISTSPVTVGMSGSTPDLMRTGNSYIVGGGNNNGRIDAQTITAATTHSRIADPSFDASQINPDAYFANVALGKKANTVGEHVADGIYTSGRTMKAASSWVSSNAAKSKKRRSEII